MNCPECGNENKDDAKFCKSCGHKLSPVVKHDSQPKDNNKTIIIAAIAIVVIVLAGIGVYASGILTGVPLENKDFDYFTMDVPKGSDFDLVGSVGINSSQIIAAYENKGEYSSEVSGIFVGRGIDSIVSDLDVEENNGDIKVYKNKSGEGYGVFVEKGKDQAIITGKDLNSLKKMAESYKADKLDDLIDAEESSTTSFSQVASQSSSASSSTPMTINGGSFSTGSSLSDKTYAKIYVGPQHAGENVKIQIKYSRDGGSLNNGNMVPKTVSSDGYIEVASADSYKYYPDYAEINIYDNSGNLLDTQSVSLSPSSGTQNF